MKLSLNLICECGSKLKAVLKNDNKNIIVDNCIKCYQFYWRRAYAAGRQNANLDNGLRKGYLETKKRGKIKCN